MIHFLNSLSKTKKLLNTIIYKDIMMDQKKTDKAMTKKVLDYLYENNAQIFSDNTVYKRLNDTIEDAINRAKIYDIIARILDAMAVSKCFQYDIRGKKYYHSMKSIRLSI